MRLKITRGKTDYEKRVEKDRARFVETQIEGKRNETKRNVDSEDW